MIFSDIKYLCAFFAICLSNVHAFKEPFTIEIMGLPYGQRSTWPSQQMTLELTRIDFNDNRNYEYGYKVIAIEELRASMFDKEREVINQDFKNDPRSKDRSGFASKTIVTFNNPQFDPKALTVKYCIVPIVKRLSSQILYAL